MVFGILSLSVSEQLAAESWGAGNQGNNNMIIEELWSSEIFILQQFFVPVDWNIVQIYIQNSKHETKVNLNPYFICLTGSLNNKKQKIP